MIALQLLCFLGTVGYVACQCSFPNELIGIWVSSADGTWVVNGSHLLDLEVTGVTNYNTLSFMCYQVQGTLYAMQSTVTVEIFNGVFKSLYTCLDIRISTTVKFVYYKNTDTGSSTVTTQTAFSDICNKASYDQPYYHHVALKSGSEIFAVTDCPSSLYGSFTYNTCNDPNSNATSMDVCATRQQLVYNYTLCGTEQMYSAEGVLDCVHYENTTFITYLTVYNRDTATPDNINYFRFSCLALQDSGSARQVTARPEKCEVNQSPTSISSPGQAIEFTPYYLCQTTTTTAPATTTTTTTVIITTINTSTFTAIVSTTASISETNNTGLIVGVIIAMIVLAVIAAIIIWCCCRKRRRRKAQDEERAISEETEDHDSTGRRGSGSSSQDEDKRSIDSGIGEPLTGRGTDIDSYKQINDEEKEEEEAKTVGELHVDDKIARPQSGQTERKNEDDDPRPGINHQSNVNGESNDTKDGGQDSDEESRKQPKGKVRRVVGVTSDGEEIYETMTDNDSMTDYDVKGGSSEVDEMEIEPKKINNRSKQLFEPAGPLTTVLVSRKDEERKRNKIRSKSKGKKIHGLAKLKLYKNDTNQRNILKANVYSSDEEYCEKTGSKDAPYIEQYYYKKRLDDMLEEDHYWSDATDKNDATYTEEGRESTLSSRPSSAPSRVGDIYLDDEHSSDDKRKSSRKHIRKVVSNDSRLVRLKHETDIVDSSIKDKDAILTNMKQNESLKYQHDNVKDDIKDGTKKGKNQVKKDRNHDIHVIHVKEHQTQCNHSGHAELRTGATSTGRKSKTKRTNFETNQISSSETDYHDTSDIDSGVEEEDILDVVLTAEQQTLIDKVLFDSGMMLRPEFYMDDNGCIVRRLDDMVIYDPHTCRFTFKRKHGRIFNVPRLKRNLRGRPTGGYIDDEYGPAHSQRQKSSLSWRSSHQGIDSRMSQNGSPLYGSRTRSDMRNVGFNMPDKDEEPGNCHDLEYQKRGRRDTGSGIRRTLKKRLFRSKRKQNDGNRNNIVPINQPKTAWTADSKSLYKAGNSSRSYDELYPVIAKHPGFITAVPQRKSGPDPEQWQKFREGLESDRKILAGLHDRRPVDSKWDTGSSKGSTSVFEDESNSEKYMHGLYQDKQEAMPGINRGQSYWNEDGKYIVRERGCPELQQSPWFTIIRQPGSCDIDEQQQNAQTIYMRQRKLNAPKSAPVTMKDISDNSQGTIKQNDNSYASQAMKSDAESQLSTIDDNRLRQLLEELYRDKKYFDHYVDTTEPQSEIVLHTKGLAEHGRGYLLQMADYWDKRGPVPIRPPQTAIGWKMQRQQTQMGSSNYSGDSTGTSITQEPRPYTVPGYIATPQKDNYQHSQNNNTYINESVV